MNIWNIAPILLPTLHISIRSAIYTFPIHCLLDCTYCAGNTHISLLQMSGMSVICGCLSVDLVYFLQGSPDNLYTPVRSPPSCNICLQWAFLSALLWLFPVGWKVVWNGCSLSKCVFVCVWNSLFLTLLPRSIRAQPHPCVTLPRWCSETGRERERTDSLCSWQGDEEKRVGYALMSLSLRICHGYLSCFPYIRDLFIYLFFLTGYDETQYNTCAGLICLNLFFIFSVHRLFYALQLISFSTVTQMMHWFVETVKN